MAEMRLKQLLKKFHKDPEYEKEHRKAVKKSGTEIQTLTQPAEWRFVPGDQNVADLATRSNTERKNYEKLWIEGPDFLKETENHWPKDLPWIKEKTEIRKVAEEEHHAHHTTKEEEEDWEKITFNAQNPSEYTVVEGKLMELIKKSQEESFAEEIKTITSERRIKKSSKLLPLNPIMDKNGIVRVGGRIKNANLPYDAQHPIILKPSHPLTNKLIMAFHQQLLHVGTDLILSQIRQHFWIIRGREAVKKIGRKCAICIKERTRPATQLMGEIPKERLAAHHHPFFYTAVDYFGPLEITHARNRVTKRYGALFTCLTTRAIYIDLAQSLSTPDFLNILRRFISIYGLPNTICSDNGTNFVGAEKELTKIMETLRNDPEIETWATRKTITWKFQPPSAPHFGGAHESLVKSTKKALYRTLEQEKKSLRYPSEDMLRTLLFEVAGLLNSRPLTYVSSDPKDLRAITPNDFLNRPPASRPTNNGTDNATPQQRFHYVQKLTNMFWDIWIKQYLPSLTTRKKWQHKERNFELGDVVLVMDPNQPRENWKLGRISETHPGTDNLTRVVEVTTKDGVYLRPLS